MSKKRPVYTAEFRHRMIEQSRRGSSLSELSRRHGCSHEAIVSFCRHRLTNAVAEGLNSKIQTVKQRACGFRNLENFKVAIMFYCGKLQLYP